MSTNGKVALNQSLNRWAPSRSSLFGLVQCSSLQISHSINAERKGERQAELSRRTVDRREENWCNFGRKKKSLKYVRSPSGLGFVAMTVTVMGGDIF